MKAYWGSRYHWVEYTKPLRQETLTQRWSRRLRQLFNPESQYLIGVDEWYIQEIDDAVRGLFDRESFDVLVVNYVFLSRAMLQVNPRVLKILDTHNRFAFRHRMLLNNRIEPYFFSTTEVEEVKGLNRADVVIGIQQIESEMFRALVRPEVKVITVGHLNETGRSAAPKPASRARMLFVASDSPINVAGAQWFVDSCLPLISRRLHEAELIVAGRICSLIPDGPFVRKLGELTDLSIAYEQADVVINPVRTGTGLNIKSIEALGQSAPLVATSAGSRGLEAGVGRALLLADTPQDFADAVVRVLTDSDIARSLSIEAQRFAIELQERSLFELREVLEAGGRTLSAPDSVQLGAWKDANTQASSIETGIADPADCRRKGRAC